MAVTSNNHAHAGAGPFVSRGGYSLFELLLGISCSCMALSWSCNRSWPIKCLDFVDCFWIFILRLIVGLRGNEVRHVSLTA